LLLFGLEPNERADTASATKQTLFCHQWFQVLHNAVVQAFFTATPVEKFGGLATQQK